MRITALILGLMVAWVATFTGCGDNQAPPQGEAKELVTFGFLAANNPGLPANAATTINGDTISAKVPFGTDVTALVATFESTGASVTVGGVAQTSGVTKNSFTAPVIYRVTAADATTRDYTVTVTVAPASAKQLTSFAFLAAKNAGLGADVTATINGAAIAATVPAGTNVTALIATFATTGASVNIGATAQVSGTTANNFSSPVTYRVTAADSSTQDYTVTVTVAPSTAKAITAYSFASANNAGLGADVTATINGTAIAATVPFGTNVTALVATFATTGTSVKVGATAQVSGATANNFTAPVAYTVTAGDGTTQVFTVTVTVALNPSKAITAYSFLSVNNGGLGANVTATINGAAIAATVPFGTDVTALVATFTTTGTSVTVGGTAQVSGVTPHNFTAPVAYTVTAADSTTAVFTVTVTVAPSPAKDITSYQFLSVNNGGLGANVTATINGAAIAATVPFGTDVTALVATFATTGASVAVGGTAQTSGITANNFTTPVTYTVTAANGSTAVFTVTVTVALNPAKAITAYAFLSVDNPALGANVTATINGTAIAATVPFGTVITGLIATFTTTGASVTVGGTAQVSGITAHDFTTPVAYTVTAADGTTAIFTVTVTVAPNTAKAITSYAFLSAANAGLGTDVTATINGTAIAATVPFGTNVTALVATFATTGATVTVGVTTQASGTTANNFTTPVTYTVTASDGSTQDFTVTVTVALNPAKDITAYSFLSINNGGLGANVTATINGAAIAATVPFNTDVTALVATFTTTGATVAVRSAPQVSGITPNDFTNPVAYTVTAADGSTAVFTVTVTVALNPAKDITAYAFLSVNNAALGADVIATVAGTAITATVPFGTNVTALVATFTTTGASVAVGVRPQVSGITPNNFTAPVAYTVTAADGSTAVFTVTVTVAPSPAKDITAYSFLSVNNPGLGTNVTATITGTAIAATVPFGTDLTALVATFATTGASVAVGATAQASGITPNNFTAPVAYTVTAADNSTQIFTVTVTVAPAPKDITAFSFLAVNNATVLLADVTATITGTAITATLPFGTSRTALVASFTTTGGTVTVGAVTQVSGLTSNNFTAPVIYRVTGADGLTQDFTVTVNVALSPAKDITAYSFAAQAPSLGVTSTGTITGTAIAVAVPPGTNVTNLVATFSRTGTSVTVGGVLQTSAATPNDFTNPVIYTVTAADGSTQDFTVTVTVLVTSFSFTGAAGTELTFLSDGTNAKLTAAPVMSRLGGTPTAAAGAFSGNGWAATAVDVAHYYSFTVTPKAGETMTLTKLALKDQRSGTGPLTFALRSSRDNFAADLQSFTTHTAIATSLSELTLGAVFANVAVAVEFRIYAFGGAAGGTWRIDDVQLSGVIVP
jgi:hypothetical protein